MSRLRQHEPLCGATSALGVECDLPDAHGPVTRHNETWDHAREATGDYWRTTHSVPVQHAGPPEPRHEAAGLAVWPTLVADVRRDATQAGRPPMYAVTPLPDVLLREDVVALRDALNAALAWGAR